jgi:hypothetical protein
MSQEERETVRRQLANAQENLRLIQERKSEYAISTEVPIDLIKQERQIEGRIAELKAALSTARVGVMTHGLTTEAANAEYRCDFTAHFAEGALPDEAFWNGTVLPHFKRLRAEFSRSGIARLDLYGKMHSAAALAFGCEFRRPTGFQVRIDHYGTLWDADARPDLMHDIVFTEVSSGPAGLVLVELSMTQSVAQAVDNWLEENNTPVARRVRIAPAAGPHQRSVRDNAHAVAIAQEVRDHLDALRRAHPGEPIHLFDAQPLSLAVCIGRELGTAGPVQTYVHRKGADTYQKAALLSS